MDLHHRHSDHRGAQTSPGGATILEIPYQPVAVFPTGGPADTTAGGQLYMYPNPATPTSYIPFAMMANPGDSITGQTIVHQSRIFVLAGVDYGYPAGGGFATNENLNFTDPPLSASMGNQQTVLVAEEPFGYGCAGSISAGELFLVKKRGGGVVLTGDIETSAQVTLASRRTADREHLWQRCLDSDGLCLLLLRQWGLGLERVEYLAEDQPEPG